MMQSTMSTAQLTARQAASSAARILPPINPEVPSTPTIADDLIAMLQRPAALKPNQPAFIFLRDGDADEVVITYAQLGRRARAIAAKLQEMGLSGRTVLLAYPPGLDFITAFFGCLYAGAVAVPTYPPHRHRMMARFLAVAADAGASVALSNADAASQFRAMTEADTSGGAPLTWLATDEISDELAARWRPPTLDPASLTMLQYTSGSTSTPKGVMLSRANLFANARAIHDAFGLEADSTGVFWLPTYHDMGLIGGVLAPVFAGGKNILISPTAFLQRPITWLAAISKYKASISGGPNFAYDLCVRKITAEQRATLDLSSWQLAFTGAEPVQAATLERFAAAFAPCGFKRNALYPCYGMAEATLMVTGVKRGSGASVRSVGDNGHSRQVVACGQPVGDLRVAIVDPQTGREIANGEIGEVWVSGTSIAQGYWNNPEQTRRAFGARLADSDGPFLRTGDEGFVRDGALHITGRLDDLIIVRGVNHHPHDLEATARASHPLLEGGYGAAFAIDDPAGQRLVLVHEAPRKTDADLDAMLTAIRQAVLDEHGLALDAILLVRQGTIARTSSGKIQRHASRAAFLAGEIKALAGHNTDEATPCAAAMPAGSALATIYQHALSLAGASLGDVTPQTPLSSLGLDSLQRLELLASLEKSFGCHLPDTLFSASQTVGELAEAVLHHRDNPVPRSVSGEVPAEHYDVEQFPEYLQLKRQEAVIDAVAGGNPYFRVDTGGAASASLVHIGGRDLINFCAYDYIGMAHHPSVAAAAKAAIDRFGTSAGASRLVSGEKQVHGDLEAAIADFLGAAASLVFVSGHATNVTTLGHLLGSGDLIVYDSLAHNSIVQGVKLSGATARAFPHNDWQALDTLLTDIRPRYRRVLIAIEGLYSMDGDCPDLPRFVELKKKHKALLLVDEAHSLGTLGSTGRGIGERDGVARADVDLWMGTLSKSLASCGGYIAGSAPLVEYLRYTAPGFVYSVGIPPAGAAAATAALTVLRAEPQRVARLHDLAKLFLDLAAERGLNTGGARGTPVIPVIIGDSVKCLRLSRALFERGVNVQPILYPAVPEHTDRLRFFITTNHTEAQIRQTVGVIADELAKL